MLALQYKEERFKKFEKAHINISLFVIQVMSSLNNTGLKIVVGYFLLISLEISEYFNSFPHLIISMLTLQYKEERFKKFEKANINIAQFVIQVIRH